MDLFYNAKTVRLRSHHEKYLVAEEDEESISQDRNGSARNSRWVVESIPGSDHTIRLKSCYGKYLTASNQPFLLGMTGRKVLQTKPNRLDSSIEWEPIRDGSQVRLKTRYGNYLRANGGLPPWRNSVTHDIPHRTSTQDWIVWDVDMLESMDHNDVKRMDDLNPKGVSDHGQGKTDHLDSFGSDLSSVSNGSPEKYKRQESNDSGTYSPPKHDGRLIYYHVADDYGGVDDGVEGSMFTFKGHSVVELTLKLEEETGLEDIIVCTRSPLNGKLYPLRLQLPPNNATMHIVVVPSSSTMAEEFTKMRFS
ncbi:Purine-rich element-binding protein gamma [Bienertia sinuspersici]